MSFTDVDRAADPAVLIERLDIARADMAENKARITRLARIEPDDVWLDLGCGVGWDIADSEQAVGLDYSLTMLAEARRRFGRAMLVAGDAHRLPFADACLGGCRIERVLQHVADPRQVLAEVARCLRPGKRVAIFEPDWSSLRFGGVDVGVTSRFVAAVASRHQQGDIGRRLGDLLRGIGYTDIAVEPEDVQWRSLEGLRRTFRFDDAVDAWIGSDLAPEKSRAWLAQVVDLDTRGELRVDFTRYYASAATA